MNIRTPQLELQQTLFPIDDYPLADVIAYVMSFVVPQTSAIAAARLRVQRAIPCELLHALLLEALLSEAERKDTVYFDREAFIDLQSPPTAYPYQKERNHGYSDRQGQTS